MLTKFLHLIPDFYAKSCAVVNAARTSIKSTPLLISLSLLLLLPIKMEVVIDYEYLTGAKGEVIVKELSVAAKDVLLRFIFENRTLRNLMALKKFSYIEMTELFRTIC
jgi:hypothetical protein